MFLLFIYIKVFIKITVRLEITERVTRPITQHDFNKITKYVLLQEQQLNKQIILLVYYNCYYQHNKLMLLPTRTTSSKEEAAKLHPLKYTNIDTFQYLCCCCYCCSLPKLLKTTSISITIHNSCLTQHSPLCLYVVVYD